MFNSDRTTLRGVATEVTVTIEPRIFSCIETSCLVLYAVAVKS